MIGIRAYIVCVFLVAIAASLFFVSPVRADENPSNVIRIGILHSQTGTMATSEQPVINATLLAIEQINAHGGLLGKQLQPIIADGKSDETTFAIEAARLITDEHVDVLFGCWTSASRKAVKPVVESLDHLLFYPLQNEGLEQSDHIIYTGATPNQQIFPAVSWAIRTFGKRVYLIGSDFVFPHVANWLINKQLKLMNATVVGESYVRLGSNDLTQVVADIKKQRPDIIFNTINGDSNIAFFHALKKAGISAKISPVLSFSLAEPGIQNIPVDEIVGHYAAWSYFQSLSNPVNRAFVEAYQQRFGQQTISDPMEAAWVGVHLWANAVRHANTSDPKVIRNTVLHQSLIAPEGIVSIDRNNNHLWKMSRIGRINRQRQFDIVWSSHHALKPFPYPLLIEPRQGRKFLKHLFDQWGNQWSRPDAQPKQTQPCMR